MKYTGFSLNDPATRREQFLDLTDPDYTIGGKDGQHQNL